MLLFRYASAVILASVASVAMAESNRHISIVSAINASGSINVIQPDALSRLLEYAPAAAEAQTPDGDATVNQNAATRTGYRVQIFDDNNPRTARAQAENAHARIRAAFPNLRTDIGFNSPYWRVKAGDFRTRAEAEVVLEQIRNAFPDLGAYLRIVRDKINITD